MTRKFQSKFQVIVLALLAVIAFRPTANADGNVALTDEQIRHYLDKIGVTTNGTYSGGGGGAPSGAAGGALSGTYPNPGLASTFLKADGSVNLTGNQSLGAHNLTNVNEISGVDGSALYLRGSVSGGSTIISLPYTTSNFIFSDPGYGWAILASSGVCQLALPATGSLNWHPSNAYYQGQDTSFGRAAAGVLSVDTTTANDHLGQLQQGGATGAGTLAPTYTNFPGVNAGAQNPYTWFKMTATDGTQCYVMGYK